MLVVADRRRWITDDIVTPVARIRCALLAGLFAFTAVEAGARELDTSVDGGAHRQSLNAGVRVLDDPNDEFSAEEIASGQHQDHLRQTDARVIRLGYPRGTVWAQIRLRNDTDVPIDRLLVLARGGKYHVDYTIISGEQTRERSIGGGLFGPRGDRVSRHHVLNLRFPPRQTVEILLALRSTTSAVIDLSLQDEGYFVDEEWRGQWLYGGLAGFALAIVSFIALVGVFSREYTLLWFAATAAGSVIYQFYFEGYLSFLPLDPVDGWARGLGIWLGGLSAAAFIRLARLLSNSAQAVPRIDRWMLVPFEIGSVLLPVLGSIWPWPVAPITAIWFVPATYSAVGVLVYAAWKGQVRLGLFVVACAAYVAVTSGFQLYLLGVAQETLTQQVLRFSLLCATLLAFAVAVSERARQAREEMRQAIERNERRLAEMVEVRTRELALAKEAAEQSLEELERAQGALIQREKMAALGSLVVGVAHEINTPVGVAVTASSSVTDAVKEFESKSESGQLTRSALRQFLARVHDASELTQRNLQRAASLVHAFKQVAADQVEQGSRELDLREYVVHVLETMRPQIRSANAQLVIDGEWPVFVQADAGALAQIVANLVGNALEHGLAGRDQGVLTVSVGELDLEAELVVQDNGVGMDEDTLKRIYEPFFTTGRGRGATGLGMHAVYNLVHASLGGRIEIQSAPGQGTRVAIHFPKR